MKFLFRFPVFIFLLLLLGLEIGARLCSPYRNYPTAGVALRNPIQRLGWPEYTGGKTPEGKDLVVFIGNSQGVGFEMDQAHDIYFAKTKALFESLHPNLHLENWSHGGLRSSNIEILTLRAMQRGAKKIVYLLHHDNFDPHHMMRVDYSVSDIPLLLADHKVGMQRKKLIMNKQLELNDRLGIWLKAHYHTLRLIEYWRYQAAHWMPKNQHVFAYGTQIPTGGVTDFRKFPELRKEYYENWEAMGGKPKEKLTIDSTEFSIRFQAFLEFSENISRILSSSNTEALWVFPPVNHDLFDAQSIQWSQEVFYHPARLSQENTYNLSLGLHSDDFLSRGHLTKSGHQHMAELLSKTLENEF